MAKLVYMMMRGWLSCYHFRDFGCSRKYHLRTAMPLCFFHLLRYGDFMDHLHGNDHGLGRGHRLLDEERTLEMASPTPPRDSRLAYSWGDNQIRVLCLLFSPRELFGSPTIVSTDPEVSKFVLQSSSEVFIPFYPASLTELVGKSSILLITGSLQRRVHGLIGAFFKSPSLKAQITADMQKYLQGLMASWRDGQLVYIQDTTKYMVFQILVKSLMGLGPGEEMQFLKYQFQEFIAGIMSLPVKIPGSRFYRSLQAKKRMVKLVKSIMREKRQNDKRCTPRDIIDVLLADGNDQLTDDLIADNVIDLMIPGEDSVPVLITLAIKYLSDCPLALQQLKEENMQLLKQKSLLGEDLQWMDYMSLSFTQNVITETLRMGNIISGVMRKAVKDVQIKGHFIPEGWCMFTYFRSVHLDKEFYDEAYKFNPWRWKEKDIAASSFTPFGGGQRLCPGLDLARLVACIFLHHLVTSFTWVAEEDHIVNFPTVRMKRRMPIKVKWKEEENLLS